jgi:hypothetical protein
VHGTDQAAAHATAQMLGSYHDHERETTGQAIPAMHETVQQFYQRAEGGVAVNTEYTDEWAAERDRRLAEHTSEEQTHLDPSVQCGAGPCPTCDTELAMSAACAHPQGHADAHACPTGHTW